MKHHATPSAVVEAPPSIPLSRAVLCLDCERVWEFRRGGCPTCGSSVYAPMSTWLNRKEVPCAA